jgi:GNAT superfamily N-acetyltransferase
MTLNWKFAQSSDAPLLARLNAELLADEAGESSMSLAELEQRMTDWLRSDYSAVLFDDGADPVAYALYRDNEGRGIYLRQFFVAKHHRGEGLGRAAFGLLLDEVLAPRTRIVVEVLALNTAAQAFWEALGFTDYARTLELRSPTDRP